MTIEDRIQALGLPSGWDARVQSIVNQAIAEAREECALIADKHAEIENRKCLDSYASEAAAERIAEEIRALGEKPTP